MRVDPGSQGHDLPHQRDETRERGLWEEWRGVPVRRDYPHEDGARGRREHPTADSMCEVTRDGSLAELLHAHLPERGPPSDANHRGIARVLTLSRLRSLGQKPNVRGAASCGSEAKVSASASRRRHRHTAFLIFRVLATFVVALLVIVQMPSTGPEASAFGGTPGGLLVTFRTDAAPPEIIANGAQILESYGSFAVARGGAGILSALRAAGHYAEPLQSPSDLELAGGPVDVAMLASRPPAPWSVDDRGVAVGVVHFGVPIKAEWKTDLESRGMDVLRYLPQDAFIVRGRPSDLEATSSLPSVNWVGPYEAAWKVRPGIATQGLLGVRIVVFPGAYPETVEAWLGHAGVPALAGKDSGPVIVGAFGNGDFRWVRARIPAGLLPSLADQPSVEFIDPVEAVHTWNAETDWIVQTNSSNLYRYWTNGLDGRGQVIGMADTGLDYDGASFRNSPSTITIGDIYNTTDLNRSKVVRYVDMGVLTGALTWPGGGGPWDPFSIKDCTNGHGTGVASTLAGNDNGIGASPNDGNALGAKIYLEDVGGFQGLAICPNEGLIYLPENYNDLFGPAGLVYNDPVAPVRIHSDSWGADTNVYDVQARMVDAFVWAHPDMTIVIAAGNAGSNPGTVGTPATAKDVVAVGGAYNPDTGGSPDQNDLAPQASRGPTTDGRIKPTIVTIFDGDSAMSDGNPLSGTGLPDAHWAGTSYSTPAAAAAAAIIRQYFVDGWYPSGAPIANNSMNPSAALI